MLIATNTQIYTSEDMITIRTLIPIEGRGVARSYKLIRHCGHGLANHIATSICGPVRLLQGRPHVWSVLGSLGMNRSIYARACSKLRHGP